MSGGWEGSFKQQPDHLRPDLPAGPGARSDRVIRLPTDESRSDMVRERFCQRSYGLGSNLSESVLLCTTVCTCCQVLGLLYEQQDQRWCPRGAHRILQAVSGHHISAESNPKTWPVPVGLSLYTVQKVQELHKQTVHDHRHLFAEGGGGWVGRWACFRLNTVSDILCVPPAEGHVLISGDCCRWAHRPK